MEIYCILCRQGRFTAAHDRNGKAVVMDQGGAARPALENESILADEPGQLGCWVATRSSGWVDNYHLYKEVEAAEEGAFIVLVEKTPRGFGRTWLFSLSYAGRTCGFWAAEDDNGVEETGPFSRYTDVFVNWAICDGPEPAPAFSWF